MCTANLMCVDVLCCRALDGTQELSGVIDGQLLYQRRLVQLEFLMLR